MSVSALVTEESAGTGLSPATISERSVANEIHLASIPFQTKKPDFGGEACIAMYLRSLGYAVTEDEVFDASGVDPHLGRGCVTHELVTAAKRIGFSTGKVWYDGDDRGIEGVWGVVLRDLKKQYPSVVCRLNHGQEQFVLVVGYSPATDQVIFHDPNVAQGKDLKLDRTRFLASCRLSNPNAGETAQAAVCLRLAGRRLDIQESRGFTDADYAQHIRKLKLRLPHDEFHIVVQKPFVVVGDGTPEQVKRAAVGTVKWAVDAIKQDYFKRDPHHIIDVWLFKDADSYQKHNLELFQSKPGTPFGFYSSTHRALVMDISTGGGTLVHEIVHPFMESNFEACPAWFNEGLASLYEQSASRNGHIVGLTNWRLHGLQLTIADDRLPSFHELCSTSTREFYDGASTNYAQARYLCYYLQEKGLLIKYYQEFHKHAYDDPTGYQTLKKVLGRSDDAMQPFQDHWEKYVMKLRFGN